MRVRALIVDNKDSGDKQPSDPLPEAISKVADVDVINYDDDSLEDRLKRNYGFIVLSQVPITYKYETAETPARKASVQKVIAAGVPIFAICLGFQSLGLEFDADLKKGEEVEEDREIIVRVLQPFTIFDGLGDSFPARTNHRASLGLANSILARTAESDDCAVQAVSHPDFPYDGVQFHPEESDEAVSDIIFKNVAAQATAYNLARRG